MFIVLLDVILLMILLFLSIPLPLCFGGALLFIFLSGDISMKSMMLWAFGEIKNPVLLAGPLFILAGLYMGASGVAERILNFVDCFVGRIKGGLGVVACVTCAVIGAISGSGFTGVAATGPMLIPRMVEKGYPRGFATGLITCASVLGMLIPPSGIMIIYGWITQTSILGCFLATLGPGIALTIALSLVNLVWARKFNIKLDPPLPTAQRRKRLVHRTWVAIPALLLPIIILGGIYSGIFTPTEAAAIAAVFTLPIGFFIYKDLNIKKLYSVALDGASSVGAIMVMIFFCLMLSQAYIMLQVPQQMVKIITTISQDRIIILLIVNLLLFLVGMLVNDATGVILVVPLLLPIMTYIGIHPMHFAAIVGVNLGMGTLTPPYASILYLGMRVGKCEFSEIIGPALVFILFGYIPVLILTIFWPELSLFLPRLFGYL